MEVPWEGGREGRGEAGDGWDQGLKRVRKSLEKLSIRERWPAVVSVVCIVLQAASLDCQINATYPYLLVEIRVTELEKLQLSLEMTDTAPADNLVSKTVAVL